MYTGILVYTGVSVDTGISGGLSNLWETRGIQALATKVVRLPPLPGRQTMTIWSVQALPGLLYLAAETSHHIRQLSSNLTFRAQNALCLSFLWSQGWTAPTLGLPGEEGTGVRRAGTSTFHTPPLRLPLSDSQPA